MGYYKNLKLSAIEEGIKNPNYLSGYKKPIPTIQKTEDLKTQILKSNQVKMHCRKCNINTTYQLSDNSLISEFKNNHYYHGIELSYS